MNRKLLIAILFLLISKAGLAQNDKDTLVYNLPVVDGKLVYADSVNIKGHSRAVLDSTAKDWLKKYFKLNRPDTLTKDLDISSSVLSQGALEFRMTTTSVALVKYDFYLIISIKINCRDNYYSYKIFDIFFLPKKDFFRKVISYQSNPDYLIELYKQKHLGFANSINYGRKKIREYLRRTNDNIRACISSLNKTMQN